METPYRNSEIDLWKRVMTKQNMMQKRNFYPVATQTGGGPIGPINMISSNEAAQNRTIGRLKNLKRKTIKRTVSKPRRQSRRKRSSSKVRKSIKKKKPKKKAVASKKRKSKKNVGRRLF